MRTANRIGRVVLAGTLLMSLGFGTAALADQPAAEPAGTEAAGATAQITCALKTVRAQGIQFQVDTELAEEVDTLGDEGPTYTYVSENGMVEVQVMPGDYSFLVDVIGADPLAYLTDMYGVDNIQVLGTHLRMLDGAPRYCAEFTYEVEGQPVTGSLTMLLGGEVGAVVNTLWGANATGDDIWALEQTSRSLSFTGEEDTPLDDSFGDVQVLDGDGMTYQEPAGAPDEGAFEGASTTVELPGWTLQVSTDPASFLYTTVSSWDESIDGMGAIGVPVHITNTGSESVAPWWGLTNRYYGPSGVQQGNDVISAAGYSFTDALESVPSLRAGASADAYVYFYDEGDGQYVAEFSSWDENYDTFREEVAFDIAR